MAPWAGYVRVSHVGGRAGEAFRSPGDQAAAIEGWAARRGERVVVLPAELDESGGRRDRPVLERALAGIEAGEYRGLVVAYLSRASRSTRHLLELWDRVEAAGGEVHAVAERLDASTPAGRLTRTMLAAIAEHELDLHRERFEGLRASATAAGIWQRRQTPRGYVRGADRRLEPDRDAGLVVSAFRARAAGAAIVDVARLLGMTPSGARQLLSNRVYLGELRVGAHANPAAHPALVEPALFDAVQAMRRVRGARGGRAPALLAGLVRCQACGHAMPRGASGRVAVYACSRVHSLGACPAPAAVTVRLLDEHVEAAVMGRLELVAAEPVEGGEAEAAAAALERARGELAAFLVALDAAGMPAGEAGEAIRARRDAVAAAEGRLERARLGAGMPGLVTAAGAWAGLEAGERAHVLGGLLEAVVVRAAGRGRRVALGDRVRVLEAGAGVVPGRAAGGPERGVPVAELAWLDYGHPSVLGVPGGHDGG